MSRYRIIIILTLMVVYCSGWTANKEFRSYWQPQYNYHLLNYCNLKGECGLAVANRYCQMMGYEKAIQIIKANNVGYSNYIDTFARCQGWQCSAFKKIQCINSISTEPKPYNYRLKRFVFPRFGNYRVDWCYDGKNNCGYKAAYSFCRRLGYMDAKKYSIEKGINATKAIGDQKLCFGNNCQAFKEIICFR